MAETLLADELKNRVDNLLENSMLDLNTHRILTSLLDNHKFDAVDNIINTIIKHTDTSNKKNIINHKESINENLINNKKILLLSQENASLAEIQKNHIKEIGETLRLLKEKEKEIKKITEENKELKEKTQQSRIDDNISGYVDSVKNKLNSDDKFFIKMSHVWSSCGALFCIGAIAAAFCTFISGIDTLLKNEELNSISIFYLFTRGLLGIGLLSWLSYICFSNSRRYTHESIRRKDRQHALMFGQIFLQIFGGTASKEDAIHVFKDWNMSGDTAFSGKTEQPPSVHGLLTQIKNMLPEKSGKASDSTKKEDDN
ncbi:hypothetical protein [Pectobacterium sp. CHL-2024]|uniref:hypothetical protein n=1 Tax=Pectobacterium sp. CHL-2024 TaxID=3377079 RepID=UPI0038097924